MTKPKCAVQNCGRTIGLLRLPTDKLQREKWVEILNLKKNVNSLRVCQAHSVRNDFGKLGLKLRRGDTSIVPTRNLPQPVRSDSPYTQC